MNLRLRQTCFLFLCPFGALWHFGEKAFGSLGIRFFGRQLYPTHENRIDPDHPNHVLVGDKTLDSFRLKLGSGTMSLVGLAKGCDGD